MTEQSPVYLRVLELLEMEGIKTLFGIPDPGFVHMAATAEGRGWQVVAPHHEQAGCFMADAWGRMTGKSGVVFGTMGPGVANLAAAAIVAHKENSPTIFLAGNRAREADQRVKRGRIQYISQPKHFEAAMKYTGVIEYAHQTDDIIREAIRVANSGKPGPVYVEIPMHVLHETPDWGPLDPPEDYRLTSLSASAPMIEKAAEAIAKAHSPIILAGHGIFTARAQSQVAELARKLGCPLIQTSGGTSFFPGVEDRTFAYGFSQPAIEAVEQSDLVLAIGTELGEPVHYGKHRHWESGDTNRKWIYVERDPLSIGVNRKIDVPLVGDLRDIVPQLLNAVEARADHPNLSGWIASQADHRAKLAASAPNDMTPVHTAKLVVEATRHFPENGIMVRDGGSITIFTWTYSQATPHDVVWNQNLGHLGTGLPYAIGACLAAPGRPAMLITGDSSFLFHVSELETAVRKKLPIIVIVSSDYAWGLEVGVYRRTLGAQSPETEAHWGKNVRFDKLAEALGARGEFVEDAAEIGPAIERALESGQPTVIQVPVDPDVNATEAPNYEEYATWGAY
ncbi:thiamine pyrophosphate-binding protein [Pontixanthobacter aquaemixtae]|uniref:Thiamine pyrophosphate-binding protein n=1 Tax=Pontixanthobacter aquaemixtae TaxID=1958940 RepID=A0A844ZQU3_9SPHN|nr:thiamine pyrophosphate-binding protein [Pontixanthobacter aquaemixtae]MXO89904.1 thiamine pyrophosphate-binding protein [Pontixanthobacter aquaemixtae]